MCIVLSGVVIMLLGALVRMHYRVKRLEAVTIRERTLQK